MSITQDNKYAMNTAGSNRRAARNRVSMGNDFALIPTSTNMGVYDFDDQAARKIEKHACDLPEKKGLPAVFVFYP